MREFFKSLNFAVGLVGVGLLFNGVGDIAGYYKVKELERKIEALEGEARALRAAVTMTRRAE